MGEALLVDETPYEMYDGRLSRVVEVTGRQAFIAVAALLDAAAADNEAALGLLEK